MDIARNNDEISVAMESDAENSPLKSLSDFDLALIGGGCGEVVFG